MKKLTGHVWVLWAIALAVTAALAVLIPFVHNAVYWIALGCTALMYVITAAVFYRVMRRDGKLESKILGWPILRVALTALVIQVIAGFVLLAVAPWCPVWVAVLVEVIIFAVTFAILTVRDAAREAVQSSEQAVKDQTAAWKAIRLRAKQVADETGHPEIRKLAEDIRYADPTPTELDEQVAQMVETLSSYATAENIQKARQLLNRRSALSKAGK